MAKTLKSVFLKVAAFLIVPGVVYLIFLVLAPGVMGKLDTVTMLATQSIIATIVAWGMSFNMTAGNVDFSMGAEVIMGTLAGALFAKSLGIPGIVLGALVSAVCIGAVKVAVMSVLKMPSMIISIAYTIIIGSLGAILVNNQSLVITSDQTLLGSFPYNAIVFAAAGAVMYYLQHYSVFGAHCRALGGNSKLAASAGISKSKVYGQSIAIASVYCGVAAVISLSYGSGASASTGLNSMGTTFNAMISVFIAGVLGKRLSPVFGIYAGVFTMNTIGTGLLALGVPTNLKDTITGVFLLTLMTASNVLEYRKQQALLRVAKSMASGDGGAGSSLSAEPAA